MLKICNWSTSYKKLNFFQFILFCERNPVALNKCIEIWLNVWGGYAKDSWQVIRVCSSTSKQSARAHWISQVLIMSALVFFLSPLVPIQIVILQHSDLFSKTKNTALTLTSVNRYLEVRVLLKTHSQPFVFHFWGLLVRWPWSANYTH